LRQDFLHHNVKKPPSPLWLIFFKSLHYYKRSANGGKGAFYVMMQKILSQFKYSAKDFSLISFYGCKEDVCTVQGDSMLEEGGKVEDDL